MIEYRQVRLADNQTVIESFLQEQWAETGDKDLLCKPNWAMYHALEASNSLVLIVAYNDDRPIGYLAAFVHPHINSIDHLVASIPTYYVEPRQGRAMILKTIIRRAMVSLWERGVVHINVDTEWSHSAGKLLIKLGFRPTKIGYKLRLTKE